MNAHSAIVLGVDPGIVCTGWAIVGAVDGGYTLLDAGCLKPRKSQEMDRRLQLLFSGIRNICRDGNPQEIALEESFYGKNVKVALTIGQARAAVLIAAAEMDIPITEYPARIVKQAICGGGQAAKEQISYMVRALLNLTEPLTPQDTADAAAIALCHLMRRRISPAHLGRKS